MIRRKFNQFITSLGTGLVGAPACGDVMKLQFEVDDHGMIIDAKFKTFGCGSAIGKNQFILLHYLILLFYPYII